MSVFEDSMKKIAENLSPEAKEIVKQVIQAEHKRRFSDNRKDLPEMYATAALNAAKKKETQQ